MIKAKLKLLGWKDLENPKPSVYENTELSARKEYLSLLALSGVNGTTFGGLKDKLENESLFGHDNYLKDQAEFLHIMKKYKAGLAKIQRINQNMGGLAFIQASETTNNLTRQTTTRIARALPTNPSQI